MILITGEVFWGRGSCGAGHHFHNSYPPALTITPTGISDLRVDGDEGGSGWVGVRVGQDGLGTFWVVSMLGLIVYF